MFKPFLKKHTKIIATYGPSLAENTVLESAVENGVDIIRVNFSHSTISELKSVIKRVRGIEKKLGCSVAIMADLQGPKIRTGTFKGHNKVNLRNGQEVILKGGEVEGDDKVISISYSFVPGEVKPDSRILLDDGNIILKVHHQLGNEVVCLVEKGGVLGEHKGVNLPDMATRLPALTEKDVEDAHDACEAGVDFLALSFVRESKDIKDLKGLIENHKNRPSVVAKIEKPQAVENLDGIITEADAVMVARGDLGVEMNINSLGIIQKEIISKCLEKGIPAITATQMLESMTHSPRPTRAEATDVTNAILDGSDAVMLSEETSVGEYPIDAVSTMSAIAERTESFMKANALYPWMKRESFNEPIYSITHAAITAALDLKAKAILVHTLSGQTAKVLSRFRPPIPIIAFTPLEESLRQMCILWGVYPVMIPYYNASDELMEHAEKWLKENIRSHERAHFVILSGNALTRAATNILKILTNGD